jgi:hypothetical protein
MSTFMNAELESIRDNLKCGHCSCTFKGSDSQARNVKYENRVVYCSAICRHAALRNKFSTPVPNRGPCKHCGNEFFSRTAKIYCSLNCYINSKQFKEMQGQYKPCSDEARAKVAESLKKGKDVPCLECGTEFYQKRASKARPSRKFCCMTCYRAYLAKRFDRWVANPEGLALPQCYDEFLDREELTCIISGCEWKGHHLSLHINQAHGVQANEFKRAAGFNLKTGVISKPLAQTLRKRENIGVALNPDGTSYLLGQVALKNNPVQYRSLESKEHQKKARAMMGVGPKRCCNGCGTAFQQSTPYGRAIYCSATCREAHYAAMKREQSMQRSRQTDGTFKWVATNAKNTHESEPGTS